MEKCNKTLNEFNTEELLTSTCKYESCCPLDCGCPSCLNDDNAVITELEARGINLK